MFFPLTGYATNIKNDPDYTLFATMPNSTTLSSKINNILKDDRLKGSITGISIRKADSGEILYSSFGDIQLHPASNLKLLTAASALETLGVDYQFSTEVWTDGELKGNTLVGNLYLKGKGDPTLLKADLDTFAKDLLASGIHKINGKIIADDNWYDDVRLSPDLVWSDESTYYGAQVSALTLSPNRDYDTGTVLVEVEPSSKVGKQAQVTLLPKTEYVTIINKTKTVDKDGSNTISVERDHGSNQIIVDGTIPLHTNKSKYWIAVWNPTQYTLNVWKESLQENGIGFNANSKLKTGVTPKNATLLTFKKSMPLKHLLIPFMKLSNNGHGEILTKEMGKIVYKEGSWKNGLKVIHDTLTSFGVDNSTLFLRDGSGISHQNLIPANELSRFLYSIQNKEWFPAFENSLPVAGNPDRFVGGTLRNRLKEAPFSVKAKTGTLTGVSSLSGYVTTKSGQKWIFSIMINNHLSDSVKSIEDEMVKAIADN